MQERTVKITTPTLKQLGQLATDQIGDCVGMRWRPLPGSTGRLAHVLFRSRWSARRFVQALQRCHIWCLPAEAITFKWLRDDGRDYCGWAVTAVVQADRKNPSGFRAAPPARFQPGTLLSLSVGDRAPHEGYRQQREPDAPTEGWADEELERDLDRIDHEVRQQWKQRGYSVSDPIAYLEAAEQRKRARKQAAHDVLGELRSEVQQQLRQADAEAAPRPAARPTKRGAWQADADDIAAELGRWQP